MPERLHPKYYVYEYLKDGSDPEMNVDGTTPASYIYTVPPGALFELMRINMMIVDGGIGWGEFGGLAASLTNGVTCEILDASSNQVLDFTGGQNIKNNEDFTALAGVDAIGTAAAGDDALPVRFTIAKASAGKPMRLPEGYVVQMKVQDNISGLSYFRAMVQGKVF